MRLGPIHTPSNMTASPLVMPSTFMPPTGMAGVNYMARVPSALMQHQMAVSASPYTQRNMVEVRLFTVYLSLFFHHI